MRRSTYVMLLFLPFIWSCGSVSGGFRWGGMEGTKAGGPPPHAPAHGYRAKYHYKYFPSAQVYFDASRNVYFFLDGNQWRMSVSLPDRLRLKIGEYVEISTDTDKPYEKFNVHKKKYPPGQLKKDKKWKRRSLTMMLPGELISGLEAM